MTWGWQQQGGSANDSVNTSPSTGREALKILYKVLLQAGWTRQGSSNGTSFDNTGATDFWSGTLGNSSWVRMRSPAGAGSYEFILQTGTASTALRMKWSHSAGFTGGSPSATVPPTATDQQHVDGNDTPTFNTFFAADGTYKLHSGADNAAPYSWYMFVVPNGGGVMRGIYFIPLSTGSYPSADVAPYLVYVYRDTSAGFTMSSIAGAASITANQDGIGYSYYKKGLVGEAWVVFRGLGYNGSTVNDASQALGVNPYDGDDNYFPILAARRGGDGQNGWKGWVPIDVINFAGSARTDGDYADVDLNGDGVADFRMAYYDEVAFRWPDGVIPTL